MMRRVLAFSFAVCSAAAWGTASCGGDSASPDAGDDAGDATTADVAPDAPLTTCPDNLPALAFSAGPYGVHRGDVSDDFQVPLTDGTTWSLKTAFDECESYVFMPDLAISSTNTASI